MKGEGEARQDEATKASARYRALNSWMSLIRTTSVYNEKYTRFCILRIHISRNYYLIILSN